MVILDTMYTQPIVVLPSAYKNGIADATFKNNAFTDAKNKKHRGALYQFDNYSTIFILLYYYRIYIIFTEPNIMQQTAKNI